MKFFHLSDLHIGKQLHRYSLAEDQRHILSQIVELVRSEQPDAILIAGDIYDVSVPSAEAVSLFDYFLSALCAITPQIPILLIAGNHDSARRIDFASSILEKHQVYIAGLPPMHQEEKIHRVTLQDEYGEVDFYLLPFVKPSYVKGIFEEEIKGYDMAVKKLIEREEIDPTRRNVILTHQFYTASGVEPQTCDSEIAVVGGIENVDIAALEPFDYAALGHIHRAQKMGNAKNRYCGTPLAYSVSEAGEEKSVTVVTLKEKGSEPEIMTLPLTPLRKVRKLTGNLETILDQATEEMREDYVSITLTDEVEAYQPKEQLEEKFDHILEIRIDNARTRKLMELTEQKVEDLNPYEAFCAFFLEMNQREMTEEEDKILRSVLLEQNGGKVEE